MMKTDSGRLCHAPAIFGIALLASGVPAVAGMFEAFAFGDKVRQEATTTAGNLGTNGMKPGVRGILEDYLTTYIPTDVTFGTPILPPIPGGFFGPGSDPFIGQIDLRGEPIDPAGLGPTDTVIRRPVDPVQPTDPVGHMGMVPIEIVQLSLVSVNPINVTYGGGNLERWEVRVDLSPSVPSQPMGQVTTQKTHPNGGTFDSILPVIPRFVFVRVFPGPPITRVLDAGAMGLPPLQLFSFGDPWVHLVNPALEIITSPGTNWVPGVLEVVPGDITSQEPQQFDEVTPDGVTVRHRICPSQRRFCIYRVTCQQSAFKSACGGADCPINCSDLCVGPTCVDTCPLNYTNSCGPGCCQEFTWTGDCIVAPPGLPACPVGNPCTCQAQLGACCDDAGNCDIKEECDCELGGGRFIPGVFACGPFGACCFGDGTCQEMAEACCINRGGTFLGDSCDPVQACCLDNGICTMAEPDCCTVILGGNPQGFGSACSPALMPCCLPDGSCQFVDPLCCDDLMGTPLPAGAACDGTLQACCLPGGACQEMDRDCCIQDGGVPQGVGSNCLSADCAGADCEPLPSGDGCTQTGCGCFGECINGGYCDDPACCIDPNDCLCYAPHNQHSIKLCGDCFGECLGGSYCDDPAEPNCWINPAGPACYVPSHPVSAYLCKDCFGRCLADGSYCDGPNPDCCLGGPGTCQCYPPTSPTSLKMCPDVDRCEARCVNYNPFTGQNTVTDCDCVGWHGCHINLPGGTDGRAAVQRGTGNPCVVNDNGGGTVTLPPAGCEYLSPDDVHAIINGLPAGTTIELATIHKDFICHVPGQQNPVCTFPTLVDCEEAGGSLGGEKECSESNLDIQMTGTGALAGFNRSIVLPIAFETHTAPRTPGDPVQSFDTDMFRLFGQITNPGAGDPDFDLLRIVAGTDFGLPSPGHTTLTKLPGGPNWAVDSFFDITYRIDFVGRPGGPLGGMSGSTTGTIRMATGAGPECVGQCPPGTTCEESRVVQANGNINICCNCVEVTGACCLDDGSCINTVPAACPGTFLPGVVCSGTLEACCDPSGISCQMRDPACCSASGGTPMGPGSNCAGIQTGCCLPGNAVVPPSCIMADPQCCVNAGGTPQPGAQCTGAQACCLSNGSCMNLDPICCDDLGGISQGAGSVCLGDLDGDGTDDACEPGNCGPLPDGSACSQTGCGCFGECINGSYCDAPACCIDPGNCLCYAQNHQHSIKLCGDCFGECIGGSYCDSVADPNCWINPGGPACYVPNHPVSAYLCKDCFGSCLANGSYCDGPNPDCCLGGPANCQCYSPTDPISFKMCPDVDRCEPRCVRFNPFTGQTEVTDCECVGWHGCHLNLPGGTDGRSVAQRGTGNPCVVTDAGGTVTLPPAGCEYLSPDEVHAIINGLPAGTTIELATIHKDFICNKQGTINPVCTFSPLVDCDEPGGSLGGEKECVMSTLEMNLTGTGALAGFNRMVVVPIGFETHTAPRTPGDPVQSFDTDMFRLFGEIANPGSGDPDFDLLRVVGGTDFGLPSPGHTTLVQLPGGNWAVDSFFDITYRIDFVGRPGGPLSGMSGSTTGTIRMATGGGLDCVGECPPGFTCNRTDTANADGTINTCCNCVPPVLDQGCCIMDATGFGCINALPAECLAMGGTPQGPGNLCSTPQACCMPDDRCMMIDPLCCDDIGGTPQGSGMGCHLYGDIEPKQNGDGDVDVDDILKVLDAFVDPVNFPNGDIMPCGPLDCTTAADCAADPTGPVCLAVGHCGCMSNADCDVLGPGIQCINGRCRGVDVDDVIAILDAFAGIYACPDEPCP